MSFLTSLFRTVYAKRVGALTSIPGPAPQFPMGNLLDLTSGDPLWKVMNRYGQNHGAISLMWIGSHPSVVLNCPDAVAHVLLDTDELAEQSSESEQSTASRCPMKRLLPTNQADFYKNLPRKALLPMLTKNSPFVARDEKEPWTTLSEKDPFNQPYFEDWLSSQVFPLQEFLETRSAELVGQTELDSIPVYQALQRIVFDGFSLAVNGRIFPPEIYEQFRLMCQEGTKRMALSTTVGNWAIPRKPRSKAYQQASQQWFLLFSRVVSDAKVEGSTQSLLQWIKEYSGDVFTDEQLRDYCAGIYPGGAVSVPSAIVNALHLLWQHPEQLAVLQHAIDELMVVPLTYDRLNNCLPLEQVMREALRLAPPVPFFTRNVSPDKSIQLGQHEIPANTQLFINNWSIHRTSTYWTNPDRFIPERWDRATIEANPFGSKHYFPFGRGKRACIGQDFAKYTIKLTLAVLLSKLDIQFDDEPNKQEYHFAVAVPSKVRAVFKYRKGDNDRCQLTHRQTQEIDTSEIDTSEIDRTPLDAAQTHTT